MVSKAKSVKGSSAGVAYIQSDKELGDALELDRNGIVSDRPSEILKEFRLLQDANTRCDKNTISIVISPSDEKKFTPEELREIGKKHLKGLGLEQNQYLMTMHNSTGKPHIHILANRIDEKGKALKDSNISLKCQEISEKIAKEKGLITAKDVAKVREIEHKPIKQEIFKAHVFAVENSNDFREYKDLMQGRGIQVLDSINKKGELQGYRLLHKESGLNFKSSQISKEVGILSLVKNQIELPKLTPTLMNATMKIAQTMVRQASRGFGY